MKILFVGYRDMRHSKFGGYDFITEYPNSNYLDAKKLPFGFIPVGTKGKKINLLFLDLFARLQSKKYDIIHFFYSDFMLFNFCPKDIKCSYIATVHMNTQVIKSKQIAILRSYNKVICLSSDEEKNLKDKGINAFFVPHGFKKPIFDSVPLEEFDESKINIFYSGVNYRDLPLFIKIVQNLQCLKDNIIFHAIGQNNQSKELLLSLKNVRIYPRLTDATYYTMLSKCDFNFLPLTFATANNALLEAQSLGIRSILPSISGVFDYSDKNNNIYYKQYDDLLKIFINIKKNYPNNKLIEFSTQFDWQNVFMKLEQVYKK